MGLLHEMNNYNHTRATRPGARNSDSICSCEHHHRRVTHHPPSLIIRRHLVNSPPNVVGSSQPCFTGTTNEKSHFQIPYQSVGWWMVVAGRSVVGPWSLTKSFRNPSFLSVRANHHRHSSSSSSAFLGTRASTHSVDSVGLSVGGYRKHCT